MNKAILPYRVNSKLIRLGNKNDGGYIIEEGTLSRVDALYSYGVGNNTSFEEDFVRLTNKPVFLFDHTVSDPQRSGMIFQKEGLAGTIKQGFNNFSSICKHQNVLLKIDVEGAEIEWIEQTDFDKLPVDTLVMEFHNLPYDLTYIEKIKNQFNIIWIHGNNYKGIRDGVPIILETTFVRNDINIFDGWAKQKFPLKELDSPNIKGRPDIEMDFRQYEIPL